MTTTEAYKILYEADCEVGGIELALVVWGSSKCPECRMDGFEHSDGCSLLAEIEGDEHAVHQTSR
jgi:hypothetical protein